MYIRSVHIENIRSIETFYMAFEEGREAGWHVLIGENGSGKTTIARAVAAVFFEYSGLLGSGQIAEKWLRAGSWKALVTVDVIRDSIFDETSRNSGEEVLRGVLPIAKSRSGEFIFGDRPKYYSIYLEGKEFLEHHVERDAKGWFMAGFGPFRRLRGGVKVFDESFEKANPKTMASISLFRDDIAFSEIDSWLKTLQFQFLEGKSSSLNAVIRFINLGKLLPNDIVIKAVSSDGVTFGDSRGVAIDILDLSDGYRSVLSLTFELIRQLIRTYGEEKVFANIQKGEMTIPLPGVVIIDEVDAHLHPTWQTKIGQWFTKYFPQLQFIVTTHSPLICRACGDHGKIFKLVAPGSEIPSGEITGLNRDRLVYGDILEAYETDAFGDGVEWSDEGRRLQKEYRELVYKRRFGVKMTKKEEARLGHLKGIFHSHVEAD